MSLDMAEVRRRLSQMMVERAAYQTRQADLQDRLGLLQAHREATERAQLVARELAQEIQQQAHGRIAAVVTRCLEAVFGEGSYAFSIRFEEKRGKTDAVMVLRQGDLEIEDFQQAVGGGVVDVVAFALRLAALRLARPARRMLLVLDEPFRFLSQQYRPAAAELLKSLSSDMGVQIVLVTHMEDFVLGKVIRIGEEDEGPF